MSERDGYEPGVPCWVTAVHPDAEAAARFYAELFGWETENLMPPDHPGKYIVCRLRGRDAAAVVSQHGAPPPPRPVWTTHVWVDSADDAAAKATAAGGTAIGEPFDSPGGGRQAILADPAGAVFSVWEPQQRRGAQVVNEPSAWAMSMLNTPDPEAAKDFYGAVFGWETETFEVGDAAVTLWRVPGYVGGEPEQPVARDVVGVMASGNDAPPHWSVDFWVHDVDKAAQNTTELGGNVVVPPYDVPGFRQAVLADPQGAAFTVSRLNVPG
jgi:predicted enzyme related to lactoylglutathione lyase